jgi:hypothetical protein
VYHPSTAALEADSGIRQTEIQAACPLHHPESGQARLGHPITDEPYTRGEFGPVPKHIIPVRRELVREGATKETKEGWLPRIVALIPAQSTWFSAEELQTIDWWITHIDKDHTADSISEKIPRLRLGNCKDGRGIASHTRIA